MSDERALVSAVITSYKRDKDTVGRAVKSILSQTCPVIEILIIDDNRGKGSELFSKGLLEVKELSEKIQVIPTEGGHGAQYARNTGIRHAKGKYIAFLDDDDEWLPEKVEKQVKCLMEHPEAGLCYSDGYRIDERTDPPIKGIIHGHNFVPNATYRELLHEDRIGTTSQAMIPVATFEKVGMFDTDMPARQDYEMWLRISRSFPVIGIPEGLYQYHKAHDAGQITLNWRKNVEAHRLLYKKYREDIIKDRDARFNVEFHIAHYMREGASQEKSLKIFICALGHYVRSLFISPQWFLIQGKYRLEHEKKKRFVN